MRTPAQRPWTALLLLLTLIAPLHLRAQTAANNAGRQQLIDSLDTLAAAQTAARRAVIAQIHTEAQARVRQAHVRATLLRLLGPLPPKSPLNPRILGESRFPGGLRIQKIVFESQPDFPVTALLFLPAEPPGVRMPAILMAPGHGASGKVSDLPYALAFAARGFAVLAFDPIGQGERLQYPNPAAPGQSLLSRSTGEHAEAGLQPVLLGQTLARYMLVDSLRAVDYLLTRPEIDPARIGAFGCSGGGFITALHAALDPRLAAAGVACFTTSFDALLPALGPQDGEQSIPGFLAAGLDFPDYSELFAPRPYAIVATTEDMFPFAGAQSTEAEARRFYALFQSASPPPTANNAIKPVDSTSFPTAGAQLHFITGPGTHGHLAAVLPRILAFFTQALHPTPPAVDGIALKLSGNHASPGAHACTAEQKMEVKPSDVPASALQVTSTGQVLTSYPNSATVFTLNEAQFAALPRRKPLTRTQLRQAIRQVTAVSATPGEPAPGSTPSGSPDPNPILHRLRLNTAPGIDVDAEFYRPPTPGRHPVRLILRSNLADPARGPEIVAYTAAARAGTAIFVLTPRPSPAGTEEEKSPLLGPFYLLGLRAELTGRTLLGLRVDDVLRALDFLASGAIGDPTRITAEASGPLALVLLHAAALDSRLTRITLVDLPPTYAQILRTPIPRDLAPAVLPGVLLRYDIPDLLRTLGFRALVVPTSNPGPTTSISTPVR